MPRTIQMPPRSTSQPLVTPAAAASSLSATLRIVGTVTAQEDLEIAARVDGAVNAPNHCIVVQPGAKVEADLLGRDITVHGHVRGRLTGTEIVDVRAGGAVHGTIAAPRVVLEEGGLVQGRVETRPVDAALRVAEYRRRQS
jgi:cytoskeletal protein CcmA (bactofilin family)